MSSERPRVAMYWASSCGGCEVALLNLHERFLEFDARFELVFCPCLGDTKRRDLEAMDDGDLAVAFVNGAVRTTENEEMLRLLRRKSRALVAFGSCACEGCVPGLANLESREAHLRSAFGDGPSLSAPEGPMPATRVAVAEGELELPAWLPALRTLAQVTDVDYFVPGCPPEPAQVWNVVEAFSRGAPPRGAVLGASAVALCEECPRTRGEKRVSRFFRVHEIVPEPSRCLLEQGVLCMGPATRGGCGALCPEVNMPCIGCYGACEGVRDQGAKMLSAVASILDLGETRALSADELALRVDAALEGLHDTVGAFYKFGLAASLLGGRR